LRENVILIHNYAADDHLHYTPIPHESFSRR